MTYLESSDHGIVAREDPVKAWSGHARGFRESEPVMIDNHEANSRSLSPSHLLLC